MGSAKPVFKENELIRLLLGTGDGADSRGVLQVCGMLESHAASSVSGLRVLRALTSLEGTSDAAMVVHLLRTAVSDSELRQCQFGEHVCGENSTVEGCLLSFQIVQAIDGTPAGRADGGVGSRKLYELFAFNQAAVQSFVLWQRNELRQWYGVCMRRKMGQSGTTSVDAEIDAASSASGPNSEESNDHSRAETPESQSLWRSSDSSGGGRRTSRAALGFLSMSMASPRLSPMSVRQSGGHGPSGNANHRASVMSAASGSAFSSYVWHSVATSLGGPGGGGGSGAAGSGAGAGGAGSGAGGAGSGVSGSLGTRGSVSAGLVSTPESAAARDLLGEGGSQMATPASANWAAAGAAMAPSGRSHSISSQVGYFVSAKVEAATRHLAEEVALWLDGYKAYGKLQASHGLLGRDGIVRGETQDSGEARHRTVGNRDLAGPRVDHHTGPHDKAQSSLAGHNLTGPSLASPSSHGSSSSTDLLRELPVHPHLTQMVASFGPLSKISVRASLADSCAPKGSVDYSINVVVQNLDWRLVSAMAYDCCSTWQALVSDDETECPHLHCGSKFIKCKPETLFDLGVTTSQPGHYQQHGAYQQQGAYQPSGVNFSNFSNGSSSAMFSNVQAVRSHIGSLMGTYAGNLFALSAIRVAEVDKLFKAEPMRTSLTYVLGGRVNTLLETVLHKSESELNALRKISGFHVARLTVSSACCEEEHTSELPSEQPSEQVNTPNKRVSDKVCASSDGPSSLLTSKDCFVTFHGTIGPDMVRVFASDLATGSGPAAAVMVRFFGLLKILKERCERMTGSRRDSARRLIDSENPLARFLYLM